MYQSAEVTKTWQRLSILGGKTPSRESRLHQRHTQNPI